MTRVGAFDPITVACRNGHSFTTTVRRTGTKCPECTTTVYVRKDGTTGQQSTPAAKPVKKISSVRKVQVTPRARRSPRPVRTGSGKPDSIQPTSGPTGDPKPPTGDPGNSPSVTEPEPVGKNPKSARHRSATPYDIY